MAIIGEASQKFVSIEKIRDGVVITKDGTMCGILMTNSLNLSLKSDDEQKAVLMQFQNLLNSLEYPVQIFIQSRRLDIRPYLALLDSRKREVAEDLLKIQIHEYIDFIRKFTETTNVMTKHFFMIVPYIMPIMGNKSNSGGIGNILSSSPQTNGNADAMFAQHKMQLDQRLAVIMQGLSGFGVRSAQLNTEEVVELFYKMYNPGEQDRSAPAYDQSNGLL